MKSLICNQQKASEYLEHLFKIKKEMATYLPQEQDVIWIQHFHKFADQGFNTDNLPRLLALIHPDFYFKNTSSFDRNLSWKDNTRFTSGITQTDRCQAREYTFIDCIFNSIPGLRGKCQADHRWPNSLGGPSVLDNRLILCRYHNGMKSNDISHFNWFAVPSWLKGYIEKIHRLKT